MSAITKRFKARSISGTASLAVLMLGLCAGGAYALTAAARHAAHAKRRTPAPSLTAKPNHFTDLRWALFTLQDHARSVTYECSLDGSRFARCPARVLYGLVETAPHASASCTASGKRKPAGKGRCTATRKHATKRARGPTASSRAAKKNCTAVKSRARKGRGSKRARRGSSASCASVLQGVGKLLAFGGHTFRVRARAKGQQLSNVVVYSWTVLTAEQLRALEEGASARHEEPEGEVKPLPQPKSFIIQGAPAGPLYPGASRTIPLVLINPNSVPIEVTDLMVTVAASPPECPASANVRIVESSASPAIPLTVPPNGSVTLPAQGVSAPSIQFLDLPVSQNACRGASFRLAYYGSAHS